MTAGPRGALPLLEILSVAVLPQFTGHTFRQQLLQAILGFACMLNSGGNQMPDSQPSDVVESALHCLALMTSRKA